MEVNGCITRFPWCCSWICNEVVQTTDWAWRAITTWRARGCHCRAPRMQTQLPFYLSNREEWILAVNINLTMRGCIRNWKMPRCVFSSPESCNWYQLLGNTDVLTHHLDPPSAPYSLKSSLKLHQDAQSPAEKRVYVKNLLMVSHSWYLCIPQEA